MKLFIAFLLMFIVLYFSSCATVSSIKNSGFYMINLGDSEMVVISKLGQPSMLESPSLKFVRYSEKGCAHPCAKRFWYENRLTLDTEAWSIDFDHDGKVIKKSYWASP